MFSLFILKRWQLLVLLAVELLFFILKASDLVFMLGDGNAYWYMADVMAQGVLPYRDFFLADPPVHVLFLVPLVAIFREHLLWLQLLPAVLEMGVAAGVFFFLKGEKVKLHWLAPIIYLFSFTVLSTSDYGTGLQLASCFVVGALLAWQRKKWAVAGGLLAAAVLTKAYMAPVVIGVLAYLIYSKKYQELKNIALGGAVTTAVICLPFMVYSGKAFLDDVFFHHLSRPGGISKAVVLSYFFANEWLFLFLAGAGVYLKKSHWLIWPFLAITIFFAFFQDIYFAYLGILWIYITIFAILFLEHIPQKSEVQQRVFQMLIMIVIFFVLFSTGYYKKVIRREGRFDNVHEMAEKVAALPAGYDLYGIHVSTPLLALLTERNLFQNYIDTNTQTFASGAHDLNSISEEAVETGIYLITSELKDRNDNRVSTHYGYFSDEIFKNYCKKIAQSETTNIFGEGHGIYFCKK